MTVNAEASLLCEGRGIGDMRLDRVLLAEERALLAMRERLPRVAAVFRAGDIDFRLFQTIVYRTDLITDPEVLAAVNHVFGEEFGDGYQPLAASGEFPDPVFGHPVELLLTDKESYRDSGEHWRRAEARAIARRVKELVDAGAATPGEIVLLFAAGTDAELYE